MFENDLTQLNLSISSAFREMSDVYDELDQTLHILEAVRAKMSESKQKAIASFIDALGYFKENPNDMDSQEFYGICRLADDAGFASLADQLRGLNET